jgi:hypothetical protein
MLAAPARSAGVRLCFGCSLLALAWGATGCLGLLPRKTQKQQNERSLSEQDKREIRNYGGEELLTDTEQLLATAPKGDPIFSCITDYMAAAKVEKDKAGKDNNEYAIMSYNDRCAKECTKSDGGAYATYATKYGGRCKEKESAATKTVYLKQATMAMEALRKSQSPLDWYESARGTKVELERSKEKLGGENKDLGEMTAEYDKLVLAHRKEIDKAKTFLDRDDIVDMQQQARVMDVELDGLRRRYNEHHWESTADLIRTTQARRDILDERYRREGMKAGVIKDRR